MSHVLHRSKHGLVVATEAADEVALQRALHRMDRHLLLIRDLDASTGGELYKVMYWVSDDQPAEWVCDWRDPVTSDPLPLASGLLERVASQRRDRPGGYDPHAAADAANARLVARRRQEASDALDAVADDHRARIDRARVTVSLTDSVNPTPGYQRRKAKPTSGTSE